MQTTRSKGEELLLITRGRQTESAHYGHVSVVDGRGELIAFAGNSEFVTFMRSCAKFHQALPVVLSGAADRFAFSEQALAIICASHEGEEFHLRRVRAILDKIGLDETALKCGIHPPSSPRAAEELIRQGLQPTALHNNCSGKHAGMLATALQLDAPIDTYLEPDHPVQQHVLDLLRKFSGAAQIEMATDGCSLPTFAMTMRDMACSFARFARPSSAGDWQLESACKRIWQAVADWPDLISNRGGIDCEIIRTFAGEVLAKIGAEGMFCLAVRPSHRWPHGLGIAIKIEDGTGIRARAPVALEVLRQLDIGDSERGLVALSFPSEIQNRAGIIVGKMIATVGLDFV